MRRLFFSLFFISGLLVCPAAIASTEISGTITEDTTWNMADSPYILTGSVDVRNATLTIEPGVVVEMNNATLSLGYIKVGSAYNAGYINANGVTFTSTTGSYVKLEKGAGQQISNCTFDGVFISVSQYQSHVVSATLTNNNINAIYSSSGISGSGDCTVTVSGGLIEGASSGGISTGGGTWDISGVTIQNNGTYGVSASNSDADISDCTISGHSYPYLTCGGNLTISGNNIAGNTYSAIACSGNMLENSTWLASWGLPVVLTGSVDVRNATLTIEPGVVVEMNNATLSLGYIKVGSAYNAGYINANGVTFTSTTGSYVKLEKGAGQQISNCTFDGVFISVSQYQSHVVSATLTNNNINAIYSSSGISGSGDCTVTVSGGLIEGASSGGISTGGGTWDVSGVTIQNNGIYGVYLSNSNATITHSFISGGSTGLHVADQTITCRYCSFINQSSYGAYADSGGSVDARWCYWGSADGPGPIGPGSGTNVSANVEYEPWITVPTPSYPVSGPVTGVATEAGSGLGETDPNKMVEIGSGSAEIKFVPMGRVAQILNQ